MCKGSEIKSVLGLFHRIRTPMHTRNEQYDFDRTALL
jgi:hypothetical protein